MVRRECNNRSNRMYGIGLVLEAALGGCASSAAITGDRGVKWTIATEIVLVVICNNNVT